MRGSHGSGHLPYADAIGTLARAWAQVDLAAGPPHPYPYGLFVANQLMFLVAEVCYLAVIIGLIRNGAAGRGLFGQAATGLFLAGEASLLVGLVLSFVITRSVADVFLPIGGLLVLVGSMMTGVSVVRAGKWRGWRRFVPIGFSLYYLLGLLVPLAVLGRGPTYAGEFVWSVAWLLVGLALFLEAGEADATKRLASQFTERRSSMTKGRAA